MKIKILGSGFYGCHIAASLLKDGYDVTLFEVCDRLFSGASGNIPARLHSGAHYPRSKLTRDACKDHFAEFMSVYGEFTHCVPINLYCIAAFDSLVDFGTYRHVLQENVEFITVARPEEFGLLNVEGAILTGERHILVDKMRGYFTNVLSNHVVYNDNGYNPHRDYDWTIDCTFCANDELGIDRFEACLTVLLEGPVDKAVTIMDGLYPSLYPWNEDYGICSLTSAKYTPMARRPTWIDAKSYLDSLHRHDIDEQTDLMISQIFEFYPSIHDYEVVDHRFAIRAMPRSGADARLIDVLVNDKNIRIRAGKIDAIFHAERVVRSLIG